ncbi:MAG: S-layer homology domain-containing protein [Carboxydocellales bacterium]|jgi:hypothetical protein
MGNSVNVTGICKTITLVLFWTTIFWITLLWSNLFLLSAIAKPGTPEDPLVTKSYVDTYISDRFDQWTAQLTDLANPLEDQQKRLDSLRAKLNPFKDTKGHWALDSILYLRAKGVISGFEDGTFRPNGQVTRAQLAAMLIRAKGTTPDSEVKQEFRDVPPQHWAFREITAAKAEGIISGYPDGTFAPNQPVTREQIAAMIVRAFPVEATLTERSFTDIRQSWAKDNIISLARAGIIGGYPDNTFAPKKTVTRAEVSVIIGRALDPDKRIKEAAN